MSYIAFDLDALNVCPQVGAACGLSAAEASHGLLQLWAWCFRTEKASVTDTHLRGFFQGKDAGAALEAFGFLERGEDWRVRGAERYLRVKAAQREGGKKGAKNIRRGPAKQKAKPEVKPGVEPQLDLGSTSGSTSSASPALTPNTEHRTPNTESQKHAPDGAYAAVVKMFCDTFERETGTKYPFSSGTDPRVGSRNGGAVKTLMGMGTPPTLQAAWTRALRSKFPSVRTLVEFIPAFPHFVGAGPADGRGPRDQQQNPNVGETRLEP